MFLNATLSQKSDKIELLYVIADVDVQRRNIDLKIHKYYNMSEYHEIEIPHSVYPALLLGKGNLSEYSLRVIKDSKSMLAHMEKDFLDEVSALVIKLKEETAPLFMEQKG